MVGARWLIVNKLDGEVLSWADPPPANWYWNAPHKWPGDTYSPSYIWLNSPILKDQDMKTHLIIMVFVEQPLALPESAKQI